MRKIAIIGSCVSRDPYELLRDVELVEYSARSSFASAFQDAPFPLPLVALDPDQAIKSAWQRRMVEQDLDRGLASKVSNLPHDTLLVVDFIDERFDLLALGDNLATYSAEFRSTKAHQRVPGLRLINSGSDQHFELWTSGFDKFLSIAAEARLSVVLNNSQWALNTSSGAEIPVAKTAIVRSNQYLERLFEYAAGQKVPLLFEPGFEFIAADEHKWGVAAFHYTTNVYSAFAERLELHFPGK